MVPGCVEYHCAEGGQTGFRATAHIAHGITGVCRRANRSAGSNLPTSERVVLNKIKQWGRHLNQTRQEKANIEQQMSEILKEHNEIKAEFEKQKKGKENKLTEALESLTNQHKEKDNEIQEAKVLLSRLEDLNAELKMKELKMQEQKAIISQLKGPMGDEPSQNEKDMKRIYRVDDVVSLHKKVGGGLGIVKMQEQKA